MKKLVIILVFIFSTTVYAETGFVDVESGDWFYDYVNILIENDITSGYEDQTFRPSNTISVEEFVTMSLKAMGQTPLEVTTTHWSDGYIARAFSLNIIANEEFSNYTRPITRGEMARIALRTGFITVPDNYMDYSFGIADLDMMTPYWQNIAIRIYSSGVITGYPDGTFGLDGSATRAEASVILSKIIREDLRVIPNNELTAYQKRVSEIKSEWLMRLSIHKGETFDVIPVSTAPYDAGTLNNGVITDALNMMKFIRYLSGLSTDVYVSDTANDLSQHGAMLIGVSEFSHTPAKPEGMTTEFYDKGYDATSTGNLAAGVKLPSNAIKRLMDDSDPGNIEVIGHRRWQLLPSLKEFGVGYVEVESLYNYYTVVKVFKGMETESRNYSKVFWPSETAFPIDFFGYDTPWSVTLNPSMYDASKIDDITVTLTNSDTGEVMTFDKNDKDLSGKYFNVDTQGYGVPFCIIFRPDINTFKSYDLNTKYTVVIDNVYTVNGDKTSIKYETRFFKL